MPWFSFSNLVAVMLGASIGASLRWVCSALWNVSGQFAWGTLVANLLGAFAIGWIVSYLINHPEYASWVRLFLVTGLLGGLTTFSSFSIESIEWILKGQWGVASLHLLAHVLGSLVCTILGIKACQYVLG